jgi:hypothetical protein
MTGFQSGGWPKIINWGKSLMSGISQGQTVSQAATAATDISAVAGAETAGAAAGALDATAVTNAMASAPVEAMPLGDVASTVTGGASEMMGEAATQAGGLGADWAADSIAQTTAGREAMYGEFSTGWKDVSQGITNSLTESGLTPTPVVAPQLAERSWLSALNPFGEQAYASTAPTAAVTDATQVVNRSALDQVMADRFTATGPGLSQAATPGYGAPGNLYEGLITKAGETELAASSTSLPGKIASLGKKAWDTYKQMWSDNPGMAMWTTNNVLRTILAMLDDTAEKESYRRRHVGGFAPGGFDEVAKRYKGNLPGGRGGGAGYSTASRRSMELKPGRIPEARQSRTSAIDRKTPGMIGSSLQREVK